VSHAGADVHEAALVAIADKLFAVPSVDCLPFYASVRSLGAFLKRQEPVKGLVARVLRDGFGRRGSIDVCMTATEAQPSLTPAVLKAALAAEARLAAEGSVEANAVCKLVHACGTSRLEQCLANLDATKPESVDALAFCLEKSSVTAELWDRVHPMLVPNLMVAAPSLRVKSLRALGAFDGAHQGGRVLARIGAVQTVDYLQQEQARHTVQLELERTVSGLASDKALAVTVARALLGCLFVRFAPVGQGALKAMAGGGFLKRADVWKAVGEFLASLWDDLGKAAPGEGTLAADDEDSTMKPTSSRKVWHTLMKFLVGHAAAAEQFSRVLVPLFVQFRAQSGDGRHEDVLLSWLNLFGVMPNLRGVPLADELRRIAGELLRSDSETVQSGAVTMTVKLEKKLSVFSGALTAVAAARTKKTFGDALVLLPLDAVDDAVLRTRLIEVLTLLLLPRASHRMLAKAVFAFMGKLRENELDPFVAKLFPSVKAPIALVTVRLALASLKVWRSRAAAYASSVYMRVASAALETADAVALGAQLVQLLLHEFADERFESLIPTMITASESPLASLASDCDTSGPNEWLRLVAACSRVHTIDAFLRKSNAVRAVLQCLHAESPETVVLALQVVCDLVPEKQEDEAAKARFGKVLLPLIDMLLDYLDSVVRQRENRLFGAARRDVLTLQLTVLSRLVNFLERSHARRLIDIILPTMAASVSSVGGDDTDLMREQEAEFCSAVDLVRGLIPNLTPDVCDGLVQQLLSLLLMVGSRRSLCVPLCGLLETFVNAQVPELIPATLALGNMLSFSQVVIGEVDVNRRLMGLEKATQLIAEMSEAALLSGNALFLMVLHSVLFLCSSADMAIREQAVTNTVALLKRAHLVHGGAASQPPAVESVVLPWLKNLLATGSRQVLHAALQVLRQCVVEAPFRYPDLATLLAPTQPAQDFYVVSFDSSLSVRIGALKILRRALRQHAFQLSTVTEVLVPLYRHCLFDLAASAGGRDDVKAYRTALVVAMQELGRLLPWEEWAFTVTDFARNWDEAVAMRRMERVSLHLFCAMVDSYHFEASDPTVEMAFLEKAVLRRLQENILEAKEAPKGRRKQLKLKDASKGSRINVEVVVVLVRLLQKLPEKSMASLLPPVLRSVCNSLAEQDESIRDATRKTLAKISIALGPQYFGTIVTGLRGALRRGFEIQVLYYSLHHLLSSMRELLVKDVGAIDVLAGPLAALLLEDILGLTAARKEVRQLQATLKEARTTKSFHTFELLAECVTFPSVTWNETAFQELVQPVVDMLQFTKRKKDIEKLRQVFDRVVVGLATNASAEMAAILVYARGLIADNVVSENNRKSKWTASGKTLNLHTDTLAEIEAHRRKGLMQMKEDTERKKFLVEKTKGEEYNELVEGEDHFGANRVLLAEFGLKLLLSELQKAKVSKVALSDEVLGAQFDPLVALCGEAMQQENDAVVQLALDCLRRMMRWIHALPSLGRDAGKAASLSLQLLQNADPTSPLGRACFLFVTAASKRLQPGSWSLSAEESQFLLRLILQELDQMRDFASAFTLLQSMIAKKVLSAEVYDIMDRVSRLAITHQDAHVRQQCAACLIKFLVLYPLTERKRQRQLEHMVRDLSYAEPLGREAALELLNVAFTKFPPAQVQAMAEVVFVPLVARLASEQERRVRAVCGAAIKVLLGKLDLEMRSKLLAMCLEWVGQVDAAAAERHAVAVAAVQTLGFFVEGEEKLPKSDRAKALAALQEALLAEVAAAAQKSDGEWLLSAAELQERYCRRDAFVYQCCIALERFVAAETSTRLASGLSQLLEPDALANLARYPHAWVRASVARLVEQLFGHALLQAWPSVGLTKLRDALLDVLADLQGQSNADAAVVASLLKGLILSLHPSGRRSGRSSPVLLQSPSPKTKRLRTLVVADADDQEDSSAEAESGGEPGTDEHLDNVLGRLGAIASKGGPVVKAAVFKGMVAMLVKLPATEAASSLGHLLQPMYAVAPWDREGGEQSADVPRELAALCEQVLQVLKNHVGAAAFATAANAVREAASSSERGKRQKQAAAFVINPVNANRKKLKSLK
jgi:hypothetical protein